jgi:hypothetical protein
MNELAFTDALGFLMSRVVETMDVELKEKANHKAKRNQAREKKRQPQDPGSKNEPGAPSVLS